MSATEEAARLIKEGLILAKLAFWRLIQNLKNNAVRFGEARDRWPLMVGAANFRDPADAI